MENNNKHTPVITVRWDEDLSQYKVDVPQWQGGEVVMLEAHKSIVASLTRELSGLREERDRWIKNAESYCNDNRELKAEVKSLREENERLKEGLKDIMRFEASLRSVMSDNLQYPDNFMKALDNATQLLQSKKP